MTFLPILVIGGLVWWLRRRALAMQAAERAIEARADVVPSGRAGVQFD